MLLFLAGGVAVGYVSPVTYTAQGQMLAAGTSVSAAAVPSFAQAGQSLAQTYSRVFSGDLVQRKLLAAGVDPRTESVTASPIAASSVILIEAQAPTPRAAQHAADAGVAALQSAVSTMLDNSSSLASTRQILENAYKAEVKAQTALDALNRKKQPEGSAAYQQATADLGIAKTTVQAANEMLTSQVSASVQANGVAPLSSAVVTASTSTKRYQTWGVIGLITGLAVWLALALLRSLPPRRGTRVGRRDVV